MVAGRNALQILGTFSAVGATAGVICGVGAATALGGPWTFLAVGAAVFPLLLAPTALPGSKLAFGYLGVEAPLVLLLLSTIVFRERDTAALSANPLDSAGLYRVACVFLAALLGWAALVLPTAAVTGRVRTPLTVRLYAAYVAVVFLGALLSIKPALTAYRGVELAAGILVVLGAVRAGGRDAVERIERLLYWFIVVLIGLVWIDVLLFPGKAINHGAVPLPFQIKGVYPDISSNGVGGLGALLAVWSIGRLASPLHEQVNRRLTRAMIPLGVVTLVAGQYRTGYVAFAVTLALVLFARGRRIFAVLALCVAVAAGFWAASTARKAEPFLLRGQTSAQAGQLSGRIKYWETAIPVWERSPILGRGLVTGTRFEVLAPLGEPSTSTIHSTWVEALVGTGVVGTGLLAVLFIILLRQALHQLFRADGLVAPALVLAFLTVTSITGTTFELFGFSSLLLLILAFRLSVLTHSSGVRRITDSAPRRDFNYRHEGA